MPKDMQFNPYWKNLIQFYLDRETDCKPKIAVAFAILYLIWPLDLVPDLAPILGWLDDIGVTALAIAYLGYAVKKYLRKNTETQTEPVVKTLPYKTLLEKHQTIEGGTKMPFEDEDKNEEVTDRRVDAEETK